MLTSCWKQSQIQSCNVGSQHHLLLKSMMKIFGLWKSMWMPNGFETNSSSRYNGMDLQKSTTPGKTWMALILMMDPVFWGRTMMISIYKKISIAGTLTLQNEPTLLLLKGRQPGDGGYAISPWGHGPLVGGTMMILLLFPLFFPYFFYPLCSATSMTLCSITNSQSTDFSIFH